MKKIVFAMANLYGGGAERVTAALAGHIQTLEGYEVHLVTYTRDLEKEYPLEAPVFWHSMDRIPADPVRRITGKIAWMRSVFRQIGPDCIISLAGPEMLTLVAAAARGLKIPLIFSERNDPARYPTQKHLRVLRLWALGRSDAVVFQTTQARDFFPEKIRRKGVVIQNPLTQALPPRFEGTREQRIVTSCRLEPQKNLDLLIDAFSRIADRFPGCILDIYGEGSERSRLERKILALGLGDRVRMPGYSNQIFADIIRASLFVLSSDYEGISNSMLEAIALGVPTIATDCPVGGARETIDHGENGLLVPVNDRDELAQAMARVLSDKTLAEHMSRRGAQLRDSLRISRIAWKWLEQVDRVTAKGG